MIDTIAFGMFVASTARAAGLVGYMLVHVSVGQMVDHSMGRVS